jgi:hypothetical protein
MDEERRPLDEKLADFDHAGFEILCRRIQIDIINGNKHLACKALNRFVARRYKHAVYLDDFVAAFLPNRISEALEKHGYTTFRTIKHATDDELLEIPYFGEVKLQQLREVVAKIERGELIDFPEETLPTE